MSHTHFDEDAPSTLDFYDESAPDPDAAPKHKTESGLPSLYAKLREELSKPADIPTDVTLKMPGRPDLSVKFSTDLSLDKLNRYRKAARKNKKNPNSEVDSLTLQTIILQEMCICLVYKGEDVYTPDEELYGFKTRAFLDDMNSLDYLGAIQKFYERDAFILRHGAEIVTAAGFAGEFENDDDEGDDEDPLD